METVCCIQRCDRCNQRDRVDRERNLGAAKLRQCAGLPDGITNPESGKPEHLADVFEQGKADAALIASMVHYGDYTVEGIKRYLGERHIPVRLDPLPRRAAD